MRIRGKLLSMNLILMAGYIAITIITYRSVANMHELNVLARNGAALKTELLTLMVAGKELMVTGNLEGALKSWRQEADKFAAEYEAFSGSPVYRAIPGAAKKAEDFSFLWQTTKKRMADLASAIDGLVSKNGGGGFVVGLMQGFERYGDANFASALSATNSLSTAINNYVLQAISDMVDSVTAQVGKAEGSLVAFIVALALAVMCASFVIFTVFAGSLGRRIRRISDSMDTLKARDFSRRFAIEGNDELSGIVQALNGFVDDFARVIRGVKSISGESALLKSETSSATVQSSAAVTEMVASIASIGRKIRDLVEHLSRSNATVRDISAGLDALMARIEGQSDLIGRSTASVEEMNASTGSVAAIAGDREKAARELVAVTKTGGSMIDETNAMIRQIVQDIQEIAGIIDIIDDISTRTNLLSMNAAIEAAHAGDAGRGFSIVADEIRKLADSTNENSELIKNMIDRISKKIDEVLEKSESSKIGFSAVDKEVESTSRAMSEISAAMRELSIGSGEILAVTQELSGIAASVSEETRRMKSNAGSVLEGIGKIEEISEIVKDGMLEIEAGTKDINAAMVHVNELQAKGEESIERLNDEVSCFNVLPADADPACPDPGGSA